MSAQKRINRKRHSLVVQLTLIGFLVQFAGCSQTRMARLQSPTEDKAVITTAGERPAPPKRPEAKRKPPAKKPPKKSWWEKSKTRKALRRSHFLAQEGTQETVRFAKVAAAWTLITSAVAGYLYLNYENGTLLESLSDTTN